ncbi:hypothetical protein RvY_03919 [Ramazzottius varieornatus]|uniref:MADF domain-containing protein n=1 Tax=Ramazzottius varieornatus TaxID=947166 RepID=A0A1D1UPS7_RAMVA|nr:hypothetical protein RvY_03919 [Ramazzottius varieornatus]
MSDQEMAPSSAAENKDRKELTSSEADFKLALVQTVRDFPILYEYFADEYFADNFTDLKSQATFCKKQWDKVRRNFRRDAQEQREGRKKKAWWGRKHMAFLHPYYSPQIMRKQKDEDTEDEDDEEQEAEEEVDFSAVPVFGLPESESSTLSHYSHGSTPKNSSAKHKSTSCHSQSYPSLSKHSPVSPPIMEDESDLQVRVWLAKLKRLPWTDQRRAMKRMSDVLYEAEEATSVAQSIPAASD